MPDIFDKIKEEELTDDLQMINSVCGMDTTRKLLRYFSGLSFYIPKISRLDNFIRRFMKENSSKSLKAIARELKVSEQYLRILRKRK